MSKVKITILTIIIVAIQLFADLEKKTKSEISFKGFGKYSIEETVKITSYKKRFDTKTNFKGKGLLGGMAAKLR